MVSGILSGRVLMGYIGRKLFRKVIYDIGDEKAKNIICAGCSCRWIPLFNNGHILPPLWDQTLLRTKLRRTLNCADFTPSDNGRRLKFTMNQTICVSRSRHEVSSYSYFEQCSMSKTFPSPIKETQKMGMTRTRVSDVTIPQSLCPFR